MGSKGLAMFLVAAFLFSSTPVFAAEADLSKILERLDRLEKENQDLRAELAEVKAKVAAAPSAPAAAADAGTPAKAPDVCKAVSVEPGGISTVICKKIPLTLYGTVFVDAMYNDSNMIEYPTNAPSEQGGDDSGNFFMAARGTRFGMDLDGLPVPLGENGKLVGKIEMDFLGSPAADVDTTTSPFLRLRHAYVDMKYPSWDILAGQTWDFFAPLNPPLLNPFIMWRSGNLGLRHVQLRGSKSFKEVADGTLTLQAGAIEANDTGSLAVKSQMPVWAGYVYYEREFWGMPVYIGSGGLYGKQDTSASVTKHTEIWGVTGEFKVSPHDMIDVMAEGYTGAALAPFMGCGTVSTTNDGVNGKSVRGYGGFFNVTLKPWDKWKFNNGAGIDKTLCGSTLTGTSAVWDYNYSFFSNFQYNLTSNCIVGIEYQHFRTKYNGQDGGEGNRVQSSVMYFF